MTTKEHGRLMACRSHILSALVHAMERRAGNDSWIDDERFTVVTSANEWAQAHGFDQRVTVDDVERIEVLALGHVDYASKLALYVAEFIHGRRRT